MTQTEAPAPERDEVDRGGFGSLGSVVGLLVLTWAAALASRPLNDNSFFTHLATGRIILDEGRVPNRDPYLFTAAGEDWTVQSWLASVAYAGFERLAGEAGLRTLLLIVYLAAAWLVWRLTAPAASLLVRLGLVSAALLVATGLWTERPYMVGVVGIAVVWLALDDRFPWWALVPVIWIWGNAHGSFFLAPALVALVLAGSALDRGRARWREAPSAERRTAVAAAAGTLLVAAGPLGLRALTFPLVAAERGDVFGQVTEWQSPRFRSAAELAYLVFLVVAVVALSRWGRSWRLVLPAAAFIGASLYAQRNVVMAVVVLVAVLAHTVPAVGTLRARDRPALGGPVTTLVLVLLILVSLATVLTPAQATDEYASRPIAWLGTNELGERRLATEEVNGNLLEVLDGPTQEVFVDDRVDMLPEHLFDDYLALERGTPGWEQVLSDHGIDVVVWDRSASLGSLLAASPQWRVAFSDATWLVAVRR